ncbi:MAG: hemerythrin domain-containing protein [Nevskia sp.]|nr:hemerythrin domain-containing protein [Nevskia sp.]
MNIDRFKRDHATVLQQVEELRELIQDGIEEHAGQIARLLMTISSTIKVHLAAEDHALYPALARNPAIAATGRKFQEEMGGIAAAYAAFSHQWVFAPNIEAHPEQFLREANDTFKVLYERIRKEDRELYPAVEALH